jgi:hypothetical protein
MQNKNNPNRTKPQLHPQQKQRELAKKRAAAERAKLAELAEPQHEDETETTEEPAIREEAVLDYTKPIEMYQWFCPMRAQGMLEAVFTIGANLHRAGGGPGVTGVVEKITLLPNGLVMVRISGGTLMVTGGYGVVATGKLGGVR